MIRPSFLEKPFLERGDCEDALEERMGSNELLRRGAPFLLALLPRVCSLLEGMAFLMALIRGLPLALRIELFFIVVLRGAPRSL